MRDTQKSFLFNWTKMMRLKKSPIRSKHLCTSLYSSLYVYIYIYIFVVVTTLSFLSSTKKNSKVSCLGNIIFHWLVNLFYIRTKESEEEEHTCVLYLTITCSRNGTQIFFLVFKRTTLIIKHEINQKLIFFLLSFLFFKINDLFD